jgi:hypothetical protein
MIAGRIKMTVLAPAVADVVLSSDEITHYDQEHFITYARLLDAERDEADWCEAARVILRQDPDADPERSRKCWETHLERAKWIATTGFQMAVARAEAS